MTILKFKFANKPNIKFKTGRFEIDGLHINGIDSDLEINYDKLNCYLDDELYTGDISTWSLHNVTSDYLFESVLSSYLRDNTEEFEEFDDEWEIFKKIKDKRVFEDGLLVKFPAYEFGLTTYVLYFATTKFRYYSNDHGDVLMLDEENKIVTDIEAFIENSEFEDIGNILLKKERCIYGQDYVDEMIDEYGENEFIDAANE